MDEEAKRWELANGITAFAVAQGLAFLVVFGNGGDLSKAVRDQPGVAELAIAVLLVMVAGYMVTVRNLGFQYRNARRSRLWRQATSGRVLVIGLFNLPLLIVLVSLATQ